MFNKWGEDVGRAVKRPLGKRQLNKIREMVAGGATRQSIAKMLGWSSKTFYRKLDTDDKLKEALEEGASDDFTFMMSHCREKALTGSYQHLAGYMRVTHGTSMVEGQQGSGGSQIVVNLNLGHDVATIEPDSTIIEHKP